MRLYKHLEDLIALELLPLMDGYDNLPEGEVPGTEVKKIFDQYRNVQLINKVCGSCTIKGTRWYVIDPKIQDLQAVVDAHRIDYGEESTLNQRCDRCGAPALVEVLTTGAHVLYLCGSHARRAKLDESPDVVATRKHSPKEA